MLHALHRGSRTQGPTTRLLLGYGGYAAAAQRRPVLGAGSRAQLCTGTAASPTSLARWLAPRGEGDSGRAVAAPIKWYACGPTVYDAAHLGHAR